MQIWVKTLTGKYAYQTDLLDTRPICCNRITRDSGSQDYSCRHCCEGVTKDQTWQVGMCADSLVLISEEGDSHVSWTQLD
jgi:hypothetical protein